MGPRSPAKALAEALSFLLHERFHDSSRHARQHLTSAARAGTYHQLQILHQLLCQRPAIPPLPEEVCQDIDTVLQHSRSRKILTPTSSIPSRASVPRRLTNPEDTSQRQPIRLSLWRGDITSLTDICAVVNAANSQLLGCFQPQHKCIDNVLHSVAGPRLRQECNQIMTAQKHPEAVGLAKVTAGYNLPAKHVIHTVGPSIHAKRKPTEEEQMQLASCYRSCLDAAEGLAPLDDGRLNIAFCCISTGLFAFPAQLAAKIALRTVIEWCEAHPETPITDVIFDVFTEEDLEHYENEFSRLFNVPSSTNQEDIKPLPPPSIQTAKEFLAQADYLIISAGAGLSAADGLDYTSASLFKRHYSAFIKHGLHRLYDTIGFSEWPSPLVKWGYFFTHAETIRQWPKSRLYGQLLELASRYEGRYFVRTSNADGLFAANGFPEAKIATPQGQYRYLQCYNKCRPDAVFEFSEFLDRGLPYVDPVTKELTDEALVPKCQYCGTELTLCVRGGSYFNEGPFQEQEEAWYDFVDGVERAEGKTAVILELGVGLNTPGVLRWPNEHVTQQGEGKFKLVRAGLGPSSCVPLDLEESGMAVAIDGHIGDVVKLICG